MSGGANPDASVGRGVQLARSSQAHDAPFASKEKRFYKTTTTNVAKRRKHQNTFELKEPTPNEVLTAP